MHLLTCFIIVLCLTLHVASFRYNQCSQIPFIQRIALNAKKKPNKLISDDFLDKLDLDDSFNNKAVAVTTIPTPPAVSTLAIPQTGSKHDKGNKKDKSKSKYISDDLLANLDGITDGTSDKDVSLNVAEAANTKSKSSMVVDTEKVNSRRDKGDKYNGVEQNINVDNVIEPNKDSDVDNDINSNDNRINSNGVESQEELTLEQKVRRDKPPSRVKFAESTQPDFVMIGLEKVGLMYGNEVVLKDASFTVTNGDRMGLVGPNGSGKTTQLKVLAGIVEPTTGDVIKSSKNLRVAYLRQEFIDELILTRSLKDELYSSLEDEQTLLKDIAACEEEVSKTTDNPDEMEKVLNRLQELQEKAIAKGVYSMESKVEKIMNLMGFDADDAGNLVDSFSGGWKMRIGLAKILLKDPNILLLDEPTNHLDLDSVFWLEDFLLKQNLPMVVVSHDREFLDRVCNKVVDVEDGTTVTYQGNYSKFLEQRNLRLDLWRNKYDKQVMYVKEEEKWIRKAKDDPNPSMAQQAKSKEAALERLRNSEDWIEQPPKDKKFRFRFPSAPRCGTSVVECSKLTHGYGDGKYKTLFEGVDIQVDRGDRIGFVGPNGSGKSTMMRIISGNESPKFGYSDFGSSNVVMNYFQQNQADALDLDATVLETVQSDAPSDISLTDTRALLGQFMFKGDDVDKKIRVLSGGEKARVALCKMMLSPANLLLLDEPTNHLDITSKEVLEDALLNFEGSVLIISHDRYFMSQVVNTIFSFEHKTVTRHDCDYHDFMNDCDNGLKEKVVSRYVEGDRYKITNAKEVVVVEQAKKSKKNFGGSGVTSGNLNKGIKNAKRYQG